MTFFGTWLEAVLLVVAGALGGVLAFLIICTVLWLVFGVLVPTLIRCWRAANNVSRALWGRRRASLRD